MATTRDPWQEAMERLTTVPATKVAEAASVVQGLAGSWAGSFVFGSAGIKDENQAQGPAPIQHVQNMLGRPGMPEINFAPYAARTNRFGSKGGSLLGHPISFSVVGPTLKNPRTVWQWLVADNTGGGGDTLELDTDEAVNVDPTAAPGLLGARDFEDCYGIVAVPAEGLYVVIQQTGQQGTLGGTYAGAGGVGDGFLNTSNWQAPLEALSDASRYEIFRVTGITGSSVTLDPNKRLADYFTFPVAATSAVRGVMFLKPAATRCLAVPNSGNGPTGPQSFVVVPPERALNGDWQYPYDEWTNAAFNEIDCPFAVDGTSGAALYQDSASMPVPRPLASITGRLLGEVGDVAVVSLPGMFVLLDETGVSAGGWLDKVINIRGVSLLGEGELNVNTGWQASLDSLLGWFEVIANESATWGLGWYRVRRTDEWNPLTGRTLWGNTAAFSLNQPTVSGDGIHLDITVHEPVSSLWASTYFDWDAADSARLTNIIDPKWVGRSLRDTVPGTTPCRPDRAIFDTAYDGGTGYANPGNLYDLGFRTVLFPAKDAGGVTVPDFDRPVTSNEVVLDPSKLDEKQYVTVDYSNGLITLSHPPVDGSDLWPTDLAVFNNSDNPRGELVIFCSCVPYSMEEGQLGGGTRVLGIPTGGVYSGDATDQTDAADVYGGRFAVPLAAQTIHSTANSTVLPGPPAIQLVGLHASEIPPSGFVEVLQGQTNTYGAPCFSDATVRASLWGYNGVTEDLVNTYLWNYFGGAGDGVDDVTVMGGDYIAVFRKQANLPSNTLGRLGVDYQYDTTYGQAKRAGSVRFTDAEVTPNLDGSVSVRVKSPPDLGQQELFADLFSSWILEGGEVTYNSGGGGSDFVFDIAASVVLKEGSRQVVLSTSITIPDVIATYYVYFTSTGTAPVTPAVVTSLPLPDPEDILLAMVEVTAGSTTAVTDLRAPLLDVDRRMDIYVGRTVPLASWAGFKPHFETLEEAILFANEVGSPSTGESVRQIRIIVAGSTEETITAPIEIGTNGLVIESSARTDSITASAFPEINWCPTYTTMRTALLDLKGHSDLVFRGLAFRARGIGLVSVADTDGAFVFKNSTGNCSDVVIDNCRAMGGIDGLFSAGTGYLVRFRITNNVGETLLTSGIHLRTPAYLIDSVVEHNTFESNAAVAGWVFADVAPGICVQDAQSGSISHNKVTGFGDGVLVGASQGTSTGPATALDFNHVRDSRGYGMYLYGPFSSVSFNRLYNTYTDAGTAVHPNEYGLYLGGFVKTVQGNQVSMNSAWDPEVVEGGAIWVNVIGGYLSQNAVSSLGTSQTPCVMEGVYNTLSEGTGFWVVWGVDNRIVNSTLTKLHLNFDEFNWWGGGTNTWKAAATGCYVGGCIVTGRTVLCDSAIAEGNDFRHGTYGNLGYGLYTFDDCILKGNNISWIKDRLEWPAGGVHPHPTSDHLKVLGNTIQHVGDAGYATGTIQVLAGCVADDTVTIKGPLPAGVTFTAVAGIPVYANQEFRDAAIIGANLSAASLALSIMNSASQALLIEEVNPAGDFTCDAVTGGGDTVTLTATDTGSQGEFTLEENTAGTRLVLSGVAMIAATADGDGVISGTNQHWSDNNLTGDLCSVSADVLSNNTMKTVAAILTATGAGTVSGNNVDSLFVGTNNIITGNKVAQDLTVGEESTVTGNIVGGDIKFSNKATGCAITGNRVVGALGLVGDIDDEIVMGNRAVSVFGDSPSHLPAGPKREETAVATTPYNIRN